MTGHQLNTTLDTVTWQSLHLLINKSINKYHTLWISLLHNNLTPFLMTMARVMAYKAELTISFDASSFLSLLTFSSAGLTLSCVGVGSLVSPSLDSLIMILTTWVCTGYDCDVTLARIFSRELYCSNCLQECMHT